MRKYVKKGLKYTGWFALCFIAFVLVYLGCAWGLSRIATEREAGVSEDVTIYIKTNGVHTDLVLPLRNASEDWSREFRFGNTHLTDTNSVNWLAFGWGDKGFYLETPEWSDLKFSTAFKAAFALSTTAIHATFYNQMTETKSCRKINISNPQYQRLITYINNSLQHDADGHVIHIVTDANYGNADAFYEAKGSYSMFYTCNTWANNGLKACGQRACLWTPFDTGIFLKYP
ncbi:TIGR02117 family protein [Taibaiella soli]|uniref:TIGR02117 family protein n=2 Tax=Taibaiella soli TaxID=1649169 RepID=A0A2W2BAW1_9BACT|nr:TIGR02117 family protein [Taibaiella soli]